MRSPSHLVALFLIVCPVTALAQTGPLTASLGKRLRQGAEPSHRAQAALVLGESEDPEALQPLCEGLKDPNEGVRAASAQALGKLGEVAGLECLEAGTEEPDATAREARQAALVKLRELKARPPRLYVLLGGVKDTTGTLAPERESEAAAKAVLRQHKLEGYRLLAEIRPGPEGRLKLSVMCLRYPGKQLLGNVEVQASGGEPGELLAALALQVVEEAAESFKWK